MIWLDREKEELEERIERRTKQMLEAGFVEEVKTLVSQGLEKMLLLLMQWDTGKYWPV